MRSHRRAPRACTGAIAVAAVAAGTLAAHAQSIRPTLVSRVDEPSMQAQAPVWAGAETSTPTLVYQVNDRDRRIQLRIARQDGSAWIVEDVPLVAPGSPGGFLLSDQWADQGVAWAGAEGFFYARTLESSPQLYYFDVAPHKVPWDVGAVEDPALSVDGSSLVVAATTDAGTELLAVEPGAWDRHRALTASPTVVEHSPSWCPTGKALVYAATDRSRTELRLLDPTAADPSPRVLYASDEEVLVPACCPNPLMLFFAAYIRGADGRHALVVTDLLGHVIRRVDGVYLEPGRPAAPAWTPDGRGVVYVAEDAVHSNPVRLLEVTTGKVTTIPLTTSGHLEVSVGASGAGNARRTLLAIVSVGDAAGESVRNHLYVADITEWLEQR